MTTIVLIIVAHYAGHPYLQTQHAWGGLAHKQLNLPGWHLKLPDPLTNWCCNICLTYRVGDCGQWHK